MTIPEKLLKTINPDTLKYYLEKKGWELKVTKNGLSRWSLSNDKKKISTQELMIPFHSRIIYIPLNKENDYAFQLQRIIHTLEIIEDKTQLTIFKELKSIQSKIVENRSQLDILNDLEKTQNGIKLITKRNTDSENQKNIYKDKKCSLCNKSIGEVKEAVFTHGFSFCKECIKKCKFITEEEEE